MESMALWSIFHDGIGDISSSKLVKIVKKYDIKELKFENESKMSTEKEIILENLTKGENNVRY